MNLKIIGEVIFTLIFAFIAGKFALAFTMDPFWTILIYVVSILILVNVIFLQLYNYLYFVSGFTLSSLIVLGLLIYKVKDIGSFNSTFFKDNNQSIPMFIWLLFGASILTVLLNILLYIFNHILDNNYEPPKGVKGNVGPIGEIGDTYQLKNANSNQESEYVYKALYEHANNEYISLKLKSKKDFETKNPHKKLPSKYNFNVNDNLLNNMYFLDKLETICSSKPFYKKLNDITNDIIKTQSHAITFEDGSSMRINNIENSLTSEKYNYNNLIYIKDVLNRNFTLNIGYIMRLTINNSESIVLKPDNYIYYDYECLETDNYKETNKDYNNIYSYIKNYFKSCNDISVNIKLELLRDPQDFIIIRNLALCKITEYLKNFVTNWVYVIYNTKYGDTFLESIFDREYKIENTINMLSNNDMFMLLYLKDKKGLEYIQKIDILKPDLNKDHIQTGLIMLKDIEMDITIDNNTENCKFVDTTNYCVDNIQKNPTIKILNSGVYPIESSDQITSIEILKNSKTNDVNVWNWGVNA